MAPLSRLWFLLPAAVGYELTGLLKHLAARRLAAVATDGRPAATALATPLSHAAAADLEVVVDLEPGGELTLRALQVLAAAHPDQEIAIVAGRAALAEALACALGLPAQAVQRLSLRPGVLSAFDWPTGIVPGVRPLLQGLDLDWFPSWTAGRPHAPFPGGPGSTRSSGA